MSDASSKASASVSASAVASSPGMIISERIADAPTQRFYISAIFIVLQAFKFYDYIQLYGATVPEETMFAVKWILIDATFLFFLPKLRIPWLTFGYLSTFVQIGVISVLNICLSAKVPISASAIGAALLKLVYDRELSVLEHNVKVVDLVRNHSRILGQHTIKILPESTAKLNPLDQCFCVSTSRSQITVPIRMNSSLPIFIQYSRLDFHDNALSYHNLTGKQLKSQLKHVDIKNRAWSFPLTLNLPGLYRLERVQDSSKLDIRLYRSQVLVVECPSAALLVSNAVEQRSDRCTGEHDNIGLRVSGLPPLRVKYNRVIEGRESFNTIDSVKPMSYSSPLMSAHHDVGAQIGSPMQNLATVRDVTWAERQVIDLQLNATLHNAGKWSYSIQEIEDACGNIVKVNSEDTAWRQRTEQKVISHGNTESESQNYGFVVHDRPTIAFRACSLDRPSQLLEGQDAQVYFDIVASDDGPYNVSLAKGESDTIVLHDPTNVPAVEHSLTSKAQAIALREPGLYQITNFASQYCSGVVKMPSSCLVVSPVRPSLAITFDSILDKCAGSIGVLADLSFTGTPPFDIAWKVSGAGKTVMHRRKIDRARHQLRLTPEEAGEFSYEFVSLDDQHYKGIKLVPEDHRTKQIVYPLASAAFIDKSPKRCCIDDSVEFPVKLVGSGPWTLNYEILHDGRRQKFTASDLVEPVFVVKTPSLTQGGDHIISLTDVQDSNGCRTPLEASDAVVHVRHDKPVASFYTIDGKHHVRKVDGKHTQIPLRLTGEPPWQLEYLEPESAAATRITLSDANAQFKALRTGIYKLISVHDARCPGVINSEHDTFEVSDFPRPSLFIPDSSAERVSAALFRRSDVCEGDDDSFDLQVSGSAPFTVHYERSHNAHGQETERKALSLNVAQLTTSLKAKTSPAGYYSYKFKSLADTLYSAGNLDEPLIIEQYVNERPRAKLVEPDKLYNYCLEVDLTEQEAERIPVQFTGTAPFTAIFRIKHQMNGVIEYLTETAIKDNTFALQVPKSMLTLGSHVVSIAEIRDANGCGRALSEKDSHAYITISESPSILPVSSRKEFCVGDRISYALQGSPPFKVDYVFEDMHKRANVNGPVFSRIAEKPGKFAISAISDTASKCKVSVTGLENIIHDIPSVRVSEGKTIIESIHEGDKAEIIFHLYGTPPFSLTYTRSEATNGRYNKVLETHSVSGIWEHEYIIYSSVAGTFAATEVHDAHCRVTMSR